MSKRDLKNYPQSNKKQWPRWQKHGHRLGTKMKIDLELFKIIYLLSNCDFDFLKKRRKNHE